VSLSAKAGRQAFDSLSTGLRFWSEPQEKKPRTFSFRGKNRAAIRFTAVQQIDSPNSQTYALNASNLEQSL
jgi:hypothetical protein